MSLRKVGFRSRMRHALRILPVKGAALRRSMLLFAVLIVLCTSSAATVRAQGAHDLCADTCCQTDVLLLNTGYNHLTGSVYAIGGTDGFWTVVNDPTGGIVPRQANVIPAAPIWPAPQANTQWISHLAAPNDPNLASVTYEKCFCVCDSTTLTFNLSLLSDDSATVFVDNIFIGNTPQVGFPTPTIINANVVVAPGFHCIEVKVANLFLQHSGFDLQGTVQGAGLLKYTCCNSVPTPHPSPCDTNNLVIGTDNSWSLISGPAGTGSYPRCASVVINQHPNWGPALPGTSWIGPNSMGSSSGTTGDYVYRKCFCVTARTTLAITISAMGDDAFDVNLDGPPTLMSAPNYAASRPTTRSFFVTLDSGCHCFNVTVHDIGSVETGLDARITITGNHIAKPGCCTCSQCDGAPAPQPRGGGEGLSDATVNPAGSRSMLLAIPNPASGETELHYVLERGGEIALDLYDAAGHHVQSLDAGARTSGDHEILIAAHAQAAGSYYAVLQIDGQIYTMPLVVR
ncbi:MAG: T9SS type A sorting domain-containing protein [Bacteroidetes bacterium]|nr:T9SS type A sorting domain-containing protein [Bacteroidota bacterium]